MLRVLFLLVKFLVVPVDSTQSFVDDLSPLSHHNPPGITVLLHFNYAPLVAVFQLFRQINSSPCRYFTTYPNVSAHFTVSCYFCYIVWLCSRLINSSQFLPYANLCNLLVCLHYVYSSFPCYQGPILSQVMTFFLFFKIFFNLSHSFRSCTCFALTALSVSGNF